MVAITNNPDDASKSKESNIFFWKFKTTPVINTMNTKELKETVTHQLWSGDGKSDKQMIN